MPLIRTDPILDADELFGTIAKIADAGIVHAQRAARLIQIRCLGCSHQAHAPGECAQPPRFIGEADCHCGLADGRWPE